MKILRQLWNQKGLDAAVENVPEDRYGFRNIAENISRSILSLPQEASNVIESDTEKSFSAQGWTHACTACFPMAEWQ